MTTKVLSVIKLLIMLAIIIGLPAFVYFEYPEFIDQFRTMESVNDFLEQYKTAGVFVFIGLQIVQIIISVIPGQFIQFAGGYAYGFWLGYLFAIIGVALGTGITFYFARILGRDAIHTLFGKEKIGKFINQLNSKRSFAIIFVLYLIPGFPKDLITYAAGVSQLKFKALLFLSLVGRTPALMGTIMMGSMLHKESYFGLIVLGIGALVTCIVCFFNRHKLTAYADRIYQNLLNL
ncbi:MAG: VTT domain-containing protein [Dysgonamonadaceae bacterium]|nr:VTT domain-containing protein [Dysgonamonadaceae bacterium]